MSGDIQARFNDCTSSAAPKWREESFRALANWWATILPESFETVGGNDPSNMEIVTVPVTAAQRAAFAKALVQELKEVPPRKPFGQIECIYVTTSDQPVRNSPDRNNATPLKRALATAGIADAFDAFEVMTSHLYADGQILTPRGRISYDGQPETPYVVYKDIDFKDAPWFRHEVRMLVLELEEGQKYYSPRRGKDGLAYVEMAAKGNEVLVLASSAAGFSTLTATDLLDLRQHPEITSLHCAAKTMYTDGWQDTSGTMQQLDNKGRFRKVSHPLQLLEAKQTFTTGWEHSYTQVNPGDFVSRMAHEQGQTHHVWPKEMMDKGLCCFVPCTPGGEILGMNVLDKSVTVRKPLKFSAKPPA